MENAVVNSKQKRQRRKQRKSLSFPLSETFSKDIFSEQKINTLKYCFVFTPFIAKPKVKTQVISLKMFRGLTKVSISLDWTRS